MSHSEIGLREVNMRGRISIAVVLALAILAIWVFVPKARADGVVQGRVEWTASNVLTFKDYAGTVLQIQVHPDARVTLNGRPIPLVQLKQGAHVTIYYEDRQFAPLAVAIEALSRFGSQPETAATAAAG
jgi:hypothetical protein